MTIPSNILEIRYSKIYNKYIKNDIKIASLSDIHISNATKDNDIEFMIDSIKNENPNYICVLGDIIDYPKVVNNKKNRLKCKRLFEGLSDITETFIILGNHDYINYDKESNHEEFYQKKFWSEIDSIKNVSIINDKKIVLKNIIIGGYFEKKNIYHDKEENAFYDDFSCIKELNITSGTKPKILIMHSPEPLDNEKNVKLVSGYDIVLCGHYHDGCVPSFLNKVKLFKNRGVVTPSKKLFQTNARGIRKISDHTYLIYNGGWTKIANNTPSYIHKLDKLCNRQIDVTILTNDSNYENLKVETKKIRRRVYDRKS